MGMLLYMAELKRREAEQAIKKPVKPVEPVTEPKAEDSTVTENKPVKSPDSPVKRGRAKKG